MRAPGGWRVLGLLALASCGGSSGSLKVVEPRALSAASGGPHVDRVRDLGEPSPIPESQVLSAARSDGQFTIGEYVLIEGEDFGKQPTVLIGGRAARPLARTASGGILAQIPAGIDGGPTSVEVSHPGGKHAREIPVTRYAVIAQPDAGKLHLLSVIGREATLSGSVDLPGAQLVRLSADGAWAYVVGDGKLSTVAMAAPGGPAVVHSTKIELGDVIDVGLGAAPLLAVAGSKGLQLFALTEPATPAPYKATRWPEQEVELPGVVAADMSPDGQFVAVLLGKTDQVVVFDVRTPERPASMFAIDLLPGQRLPVVRDLRYDASGALWVISGDTAQSVAAGHQPTRLTRLGVTPGTPGALFVQPSVEVAGAGPPMAIIVSPVADLASGATIRDTTDDLPLFVTSIDPRVLGVASADKLVEATGGIAEPGKLVRTNGQGSGGPLPAGDRLMPGACALPPDGELLVCSVWQLGDDGSVAFGALAMNAGGGAPGKLIPLGKVKPGKMTLPAAFGDVGIQP